MNNFSQNFLFLLGFVFLCPVLMAQPCTVDLADVAGVTTASGSTTICANEAIFLPNVDFEAGAGQPDPGIIWGIYSQGNNNACQPSTTMPGADACFANLGYTILVDATGEPIIGDGTADLTQSGLFTDNQSSIMICLVPMISPDITPPPGQNISFSNTCSGISTTFTYPCFTILNPDLNPLLCSDCPSLTFNDECDAAYSFDLLTPATIENLPFDNNCATSGPSDPDEGTCFGVAPDNDPFAATVWFSFVGNGGTYSLNTKNCTGSVNTPLTDTQIALYTGTCDNLTLVACNEQISGATNYAGLSNFATTTGTTYYVLVDGYSIQKGEFCFDLIEVAPPVCLTQAGTVSISQPNLCANTPFNVITTDSNTTADFNNLIVIVDDATNTIIATSANGNNISLPIGDFYIYNLNYEDGSTFNTAIGTSFTALQNQVNAADCASLSPALGITVPFCFVCDAAISGITLANGTTFCANATPSSGEISFLGTPDVPEYLNLVAITNANYEVLDYFTNTTNVDLSSYAAGTYHVCGVNYYMNDSEAVFDALDFGQLPSIASDICANFACADITILPASSPDCVFCNNTINPIILEGEPNLCGTTISGNIIVTGTPVTDDNASQLIIYDNAGNIVSFAPVAAIDFATYGITSGCVNVTAINYALIDEAEVLACTSMNCLENAIAANTICAAIATPNYTFCILPPGDPACCTGSDIEEIAVDGDITTLCGSTTTGNFTISGIPPTSTQIIRLVVFIIPTPDNPDATIVDITEVAPIDFANYPAAAQYGVAAISFAPEAEASIMPCLGQPTSCIFDQIASGLICAEPTNNFLTFTLLPNGQGECCVASVTTVTVNGDVTTVCAGSETDIVSVNGTPTTEGYESALIVDNITVLPANSSISFSSVGEHSVCAVNYFAADSIAVITALLNNTTPEGCYALASNCLTFTVLPISDPACNPLNVININTQTAPDGLTYTVTFDIIGGTGIYIVDGTQLPNGTYVSSAIPCGTSYSFNVTDSGNSGTIIVDGIAPCQLPCPTPGSLPSFTGNVLICAGNSTNFTATGGQSYPNTTLQYVLATDANNILGSIVATNNNAATFGGTNLTPNTVYYIAAIAGYTNAQGNVDLTDECTTVSNNLIPVVFLQPLGYIINEDCDWSSGQYTVVIYPTGGFPAYDSDGTYSVGETGSIATTEVEAGSYFPYTLNDSDSPSHLYSYQLTDGVCDAITVANDEPYVCLKTPIEWLSFRGEVLPEGNLLKWSTATETNSDYFAVERSVDGVNYVKITTVKAAGNSVQPRNYSYTDRQVPAGQVYYRVVEYDFDGSSNRSNVISLSRSGDKLSFNKVYPVPARTELDISFNATNYAAAQLQVYDIAGRLVDQQTLITRKGLNTHTLSIVDYSKGVYFISLVTDNGTITTRFVKN
ncbi:MAG: T9SS type A sorting domain-containing protein [Chitinophagales bacterium]|nr:T9SS type A sorting domain-containing protein [Chitinophagales bacterium]